MVVLRRYGFLKPGQLVSRHDFTPEQWEMMIRKGVIGSMKPNEDATIMDIRIYLDQNGVNYPAQGRLKDETYRQRLLKLAHEV